MQPEDRTFVLSTWLSAFRRSPSAGLVARSRWRDVMWPELEATLSRDGVRILVVKDLDAPSGEADLFGHLVWEPDALRARGTTGMALVYFCFVKKDARGNGLARGLFAAAGIDPRGKFLYACQTPAVMALREAGKLRRADWRPHLGRLEPHERIQDEHRDREERA